MVILDDLHWADKPTLLLLQHFAQEVAHMRVLLVVTYRDTDLSRTHPLSEALAATTTLVVANRPSTIALADEVAYIEGGRLLEQGDHDVLVARHPGYERLVHAYDLDRAQRSG